MEAAERQTITCEISAIDERLGDFRGEPSVDEVLEINGLERRRKTLNTRLMVLGAQICES